MLLAPTLAQSSGPTLSSPFSRAEEGEGAGEGEWDDADSRASFIRMTPG